MAEERLMSLGALAAATGGRLHGRPTDGFAAVCIDSRAAGPGSLFVALKGEKTDGHEFVSDAFSRGARAAIVEATYMAVAGAKAIAAAETADAALVIVPNTLAALQTAAGVYLDTFPELITIGITGSSGKTTTKELAAAMIGTERRTVMNEGNLNSETGLPLSAFAVRPGHEVAVFELGMNRRNEIVELARTLRPRIALITNIGTAHIGILGGIQAIAEEKKAIFGAFSGNELALIPEDDRFTAFLAEGINGRVQFYGPKSLKAFGGAQALGLAGTVIRWAGKEASLALPGEHNVRNALAAAAIAQAVGVSDEAVRRGLAAVRPLFGRGEILRGRLTVVRDCYNANPESVEAAVAFMDSVETDARRVYIIGSMLELGDAGVAAHERLGVILSESKADLVVLFGAETALAAETLDAAQASSGGNKLKTVRHFVEFEELKRFAEKAVRPADLVLLKGSRGTALERLTEILLPGEDR